MSRPSRPRSTRPRLGLGALLLGGGLALLVPGCGNTGSTTATDGPQNTLDGGAGNPAVLAGTFQVRLVPPVPAQNGNPEIPGHTAVVGKVADGPTPSLIVWELAMADGACKLLKPRVPFCNTPCGGSAACVEDDTCQPYPSARSVGTVKVKGLRTEAGASEFSMEPVVNSYQPPVDVRLPYPAFAEGDAISVAAAGGAWGPFTVASKGIAPLALAADEIRLESGKPLALEWTAGQAGISSIHVKLDISHHGGTKGMIECDTGDSGALTISAMLVDSLRALGVAGFPTIVVTRQAKGTTTIAPGRVELVVASEVEEEVVIPGLTSCTDDEQCPMGQTCQSDLTCK